MTVFSDRVRREETAPGDLHDLREAYERGRRDAEAARPRHPLGMTLLFVAAAVGAVLLALALVNGSFGRAGGVMDTNLKSAAAVAGPAVKGAADQASRAASEAVSGAVSDVKQDVAPDDHR